MYDEHHPKIINFNATYNKNIVLKLQAVGQQKLLHNKICEYLERTLINLKNALNPKVMQTSLNAKVSRQEEFKDLSYCPDQRIYELMLGESIWGIMNRTKTKDVDIRQLWQSVSQQSEIQHFTNSKSGSIDGAIGIFSADLNGGIVLPIEAKSTMANPYARQTVDLEEQAVQRIIEKHIDLSTPSQISSILIMPTPPDKELKVDLQIIANNLQEAIHESSLGAISLLSIHENGLRLTTCVLYGKTFRLEVSKIHDFMGIINYIFPSTEG